MRKSSEENIKIQRKENTGSKREAIRFKTPQRPGISPIRIKEGIKPQHSSRSSNSLRTPVQ